MLSWPASAVELPQAVAFVPHPGERSYSINTYMFLLLHKHSLNTFDIRLHEYMTVEG